MWKKFSVLLVVGVCATVLAAQDQATHGKAATQKPATLMPGYGTLHHPVTTQNADAQKFFDQGLRLIYAFNHAEAERSFQRAAELDPKLAMAYWGIAEAVGPNYNDPASDERFAAAHAAIQKATDLSSTSTSAEQAYVAAMALRFPADPKADRRQAAEAYRDAMRELSKKYPDDADAAVLFAESGMNLHPWGLWHVDGTPEDGTEEIVASLESVLKRDPDHMGAIHYYIHATEASRSPQRALAGANKLAAMAPAAGHLVHMPAHVYIRTGDYESAVKTNEKAAAADRAYIQASGVQGIYPMMYYSHNLHFIAMCSAMNGNYPEAKKSAGELAAHVAPGVKEMPPLEGFMTIPMAVEVRFHRWDDILSTRQPPPDLPVMTLFWHFGRGMALAAKGRVPEAEAEWKVVSDAEAATPEDAIFAMPVNNRTKDILKIAKNVLGAKIALAKKDPNSAVPLLQEAVRVQDSLKYDEPPDWFFPVRESLGAVLLMNGDAPGAEKIFRTDLDRNPRNPRSLYGLQQALLAQNRKYDATFVEREFATSWKGDAAGLKLEDLV
jgi:tetratricopeptide (TPR) repeat protein